MRTDLSTVKDQKVKRNDLTQKEEVSETIKRNTLLLALLVLVRVLKMRRYKEKERDERKYRREKIKRGRDNRTRY